MSTGENPPLFAMFDTSRFNQKIPRLAPLGTPFFKGGGR